MLGFIYQDIRNTELNLVDKDQKQISYPHSPSSILYFYVLTYEALET